MQFHEIKFLYIISFYNGSIAGSKFSKKKEEKDSELNEQEESNDLIF